MYMLAYLISITTVQYYPKSYLYLLSCTCDVLLDIKNSTKGIDHTKLADEWTESIDFLNITGSRDQNRIGLELQSFLEDSRSVTAGSSSSHTDEIITDRLGWLCSS
jgi:hypothetical protein